MASLASLAEDRVAGSNILADDDSSAIFLLLHALLLLQGFVCVTESGSGAAGFAPSIRGRSPFEFPVTGDLPSSLFLPSDWRQNGSYTARYRHKLGPGKQFCLVVLPMDMNTVVTLSQRNGDSFTLDLRSADYRKEGAFVNSSSLVDRVVPLLHSLVPALRSASDRSAPAPLPAPEIAPGRLPQSLVPHPPSSSGYNVGRGDLDPFPSIPSTGPYPSAPWGPGASDGNWVGPSHPMFSNPPHLGGGGDGEHGPSGLGDFGLARYDPIGPVVGPNSDFGFDDGSLPGRGGRGFQGPGRGRGRGRGLGGPGSRELPGEPSPDHFRPPGW